MTTIEIEPRNCSHQAFPFVEAATKAELTGSIETQPGDRFAALSAFRIGDVPIMTARNKDVRGERVVFGFHCGKLGLGITYRRNESFQCVLKACRPHAVQSNISTVERQADAHSHSSPCHWSSGIQTESLSALQQPPDLVCEQSPLRAMI
jgi:hypothetical protein